MLAGTLVPEPPRARNARNAIESLAQALSRNPEGSREGRVRVSGFKVSVFRV